LKRREFYQNLEQRIFFVYRFRNAMCYFMKREHLQEYITKHAEADNLLRALPVDSQGPEEANVHGTWSLSERLLQI